MQDETEKIELPATGIFCLALATAGLLALYEMLMMDPAPQPIPPPPAVVEKLVITPEMLRVGADALSKNAPNFWPQSRRQDIARTVFLSMQEERERHIGR